MNDTTTSALQEFRQGMTLLRNEYPQRALEHMRRAAELERENPVYLSYLGLTLGMANRRWTEAERLCQQALRLRHNQPQFYLNLAEVYCRGGKKEDAVELLSTGLRYTKQDPRLRQALDRLGLRREPVVSFLDRKNILNRGLGELRHHSLKLMGGS